MIFNDSKYTKWYFNIMGSAAKECNVGVYKERHHIIPKSLGGDNSSSNIVLLTAKQHYICHLLLTKMVSGKHKNSMLYAYKIMATKTSNSKYSRPYKVNSILYSVLRNEYGKLVGSKRRGLKHTQASKDKIRQSMTGKIKSVETRLKIGMSMTGKIKSNETKQKIGAAIKAKHLLL